MANPDRRKAAATATVGAGLVAGGGMVREAGISRAHRGLGRDPRAHGKKGRMKLPGRSVLMARQGRVLYLGGAGMGLAGVTGMGVGAHNLVRRAPVEKATTRDFLQEGLKGTGEAVGERARNLKEKRPLAAVAAPLAVSGAAGAAGSFGAHALLNRSRLKATRFRPAVTALGGATAGLAALPAGAAATRRVAPGYELTPTGVKRSKAAPQKPSSRARVVEARPGRGHGSRREIVPSDRFGKASPDPSTIRTYTGSGMSRNQKRAAVMAAGSVPGPGLGPLGGGLMARRLAPPDQKNSAMGLQLGGHAGGWLAGGATGALAAQNRHVQRGGQAVGRKVAVVRHKVRTSKPYRSAAASRPGQAVTSLNNRVNAAQARVMRKLPKVGGGKITGTTLAGAYVGSKLGGFGGSQVGYTQALRNEERRAARLSKAATPGRPLTGRERDQQAKRKRKQAVYSTISGATGLGALGALGASKVPRVNPALRARIASAQTPLLTVGAGAGGLGSFNFAAIQRREALAEARPVRKALTAEDARKLNARRRAQRQAYLQAGEPVPSWLSESVVQGQIKTLDSLNSHLPSAKKKRASRKKDWSGSERRQAERRRGDRRVVRKMATTMGDRDAQARVKQYGLKGPLPKNLDRDERMRAYEARYVVAGGPKGEKWARRVERAEGVRNAALGAGTLAAGAMVGRGTRPVQALRRGPLKRVKREHVERGAWGAAALGGAAELRAEYGRGRRASYGSSPAGVAASALRRMRDYTPS